MTTLCRCSAPPFYLRHYASRGIGVDATDGRFAEVSVETCTRCGQRWLRYSWEEEGRSRSGRWFRAAVSADVATSVRVTDALSVIEAMPVYFRGGSYFASDGERVERSSRLPTDDLVRSLLELRTLVARPENDFTWSSWRDTEHALGEIDGILAALRRSAARATDGLAVILSPTGPCQELAISSGWAHEFNLLASRIELESDALHES